MLTLGVAILGAGVVMLALPGPGLLVIIVGLAVLASEFAGPSGARSHDRQGGDRGIQGVGSRAVVWRSSPPDSG